MNDACLDQRAIKIAQICAEHAAYRFFSNPKVTHKALQHPHYYEVLEKARWLEEPVLFIQDGSELLFDSHPWIHGHGLTAGYTRLQDMLWGAYCG